ncbi:helix-hairpin-helix domain-containing protein [Pseudobutyrivibrio xylanivorans]|uniref:ComEA family DNA-binding protein n=1 Tax=Pseudobutyrivibrio xylanivorans TaxID=185007 RepID=A0A5P6VSP9_PSEXY|nr:helix-hairpin-helix domain-containing protein [Pseudobutyrivibrio xylanivorans]QFJ55440.1 ComEA family DNA-binding protein [Pseudobutyrivibrio xylanivorans]
MKKFLVLVFCSLFLFSGCGNTSYFQSTELVDETNKSEESAESTDISEVINPVIFVQVAGAVVKPGVYELPNGSRVFAAIDAAGGLLDTADDSDVNQASVLEDGQKVYVYTYSEREAIESAEAEKDASDGLVSINRASASELTNLPGIGQAKADQIVAYREANGDFTSIEDIKKVSGIGDGIYNQINSLIKL